MRDAITEATASASEVGAPSTWVLSNHDVVRHVTRYARSQPDHMVETDWEKHRWAAEEPDLELGLRRARAAMMLVLALPGTAYLYQGEELGLAEVEDIPDERRQDPIWEQSGHTDVGRDGCRVPLPWSGAVPPYGFSPEAGTAEPWLPQPERWAGSTAADQAGDPGSTLNLYRRALRRRREHLESAGELIWVEAPETAVAFRRDDVECWVNAGDSAVPLPEGRLLLCSDPDAEPGRLPADATAWVVRA
jgi:alpha-glucosidase